MLNSREACANTPSSQILGSPRDIRTYHVRSIGSNVAAGVVAAGVAGGVARGRDHGIVTQILGIGQRCARPHEVDVESEGPVVSVVRAGDLEVKHLALGDADAAAPQTRMCSSRVVQKGGWLSIRVGCHQMKNRRQPTHQAALQPCAPPNGGTHSRGLRVGV